MLKGPFKAISLNCLTLCLLPIFLIMKIQQEGAGPHTLQRKSLFKVRSAPQCASLRSSSLRPLQTRGDTEGQKQTNGTASHEQQHSLFPAHSTRGTPAVPLMRCQAGTQLRTRAQLWKEGKQFQVSKATSRETYSVPNMSHYEQSSLHPALHRISTINTSLKNNLL